MAAPDTQRLVQGLARGEDAAFAEAYDRYAPGLFRSAVALLGSAADAEDAVQDVFVALVRSGSRLVGVENLPAYLFTALRHAASRRLADARKRSARPLEEVAASPAAPAAELDVLLRKLPAEQREIVMLKIDGGLTFAEAAAVLGISEHTAASRYRYALEKLRQALAGERDGRR